MAKLAGEKSGNSKIDMLGFRSGRLVVVDAATNSAQGQARWLCRCDCGSERIIAGGSLRMKNAQKSCGCLRRERMIGNKLTPRSTVPVQIRRRTRYLKHKFGITLDQWNALFDLQGRRCGCCAREESGTSWNWHTDHDHVTGAVRGILCERCNRLLGLLGDNAAGVRKSCDLFLRYLNEQADFTSGVVSALKRVGN